VTLALDTLAPNRLQAQMIRAVLDGRLPLAVRAGIGSGKTAGIALLILTLSEVVPDARILVVMKTQRTLKRNLMPACRALFQGRARWRARDDQWVFRSGLTAEMTHYDPAASADEAHNPIEGADMWLVIIDEAQMLPEQVFRHATQRARQRVVDVIGRVCHAGVMVLGRPAAFEWHRRIVRDTARRLGRDPSRHVISATSRVNLANLSPHYIEQQRATLSEAQFRALVECGDMPTEGQAFTHWSLDPWPAGNLLAGFRYDPARRTVVAADLGRGSPHVLFIQPVEREVDGKVVTLDVVFDELAPENVLTPRLAELIVARGWPRADRKPPPAVPYRIDEAVVDPAGHQRDRHSGLSDIALLRNGPREPHLPGLGVTILAPTAPDRRAVRARAERIERLIRSGDGIRRLVVAPTMLDRPDGDRALVRALARYSHDDIARAETGRKAHRDLVSHAVDALGYYVAQHRWTIEAPEPVPMPPMEMVPTRWAQLTGGGRRTAPGLSGGSPFGGALGRNGGRNGRGW